MEKIYYEINEEMARQAKAMHSMDDYIANSETESYRKVVDEVYEIGQEAKKRTIEDKHEYIDYLCNKFAKKYAEYVNKGLSIKMQCPSMLVCGPANFPTRKKEKQNIARDNHRKYYDDKIAPIVAKLEKSGTGADVICAGDPLAIEKLNDKLESLLEDQARMKQENAYYRKNKTMAGCEGISDEEAEKMDRYIAEYNGSRAPHMSFSLTNINNKIKAARQRIQELSKIKEKGTEETKTEYFKVVENAEIMRLQLIFDGKPDDKIRAILKLNGFRWSPKNGAWQRKLTNNARWSVKRVISAIKDMEATS